MLTEHVINMLTTCFMLSETWLASDNADLYNVSGYNHLFDCHRNVNGGGVSLFVHSEFHHLPRNDLNPSTSSLIESQSIELTVYVIKKYFNW